MAFIFSLMGITVFSIGTALTGKNKNVSEIILKTGILSVSLILYITFTLGFILKKYNISNVIIISAILLLSGICMILKNKKKLPPVSIPRINFFLIVSTAIALITLSVKFICILKLKVYDWDGLVYHIPNLADYIQNEKIFLAEKSLWANVYPKNIEMLNMYMLLFFRSTFMLKLPQFLITLLGSAAVYGILSECGFRKNTSAFGAALYFSTPVILAQTATVYVDSSLSGILICSVCFLIKSHKNPSFENILYLSLSAGILSGIKYSALGYVFIIFAALFIILLFKKRLRMIFPAFLTASTLGGAWYIFNWINTGNPLAPFEIGIGNFVIFSGVSMTDTIMTSNTPDILLGKSKLMQCLISWLELHGPYATPWLGNITTTYDERLGGFGRAWLFIMIPMLIISTADIIRRRKITYTFIIPAVLPIIMFLITPESWWTRYVCYIILSGVWGVCYFKENIFKSKILDFVLCAIILFNCFSGTIFDIKMLQKANLNPKQSPTEYIKQIYHIINDGEAHTIADFRPLLPEHLFFYGDNLQNTYKWYSPNVIHGESMDGINTVRTYDEINLLLTETKPELVLVYDGYYEEYSECLESSNNYVLINQFQNNKLYKKTY